MRKKGSMGKKIVGVGMSVMLAGCIVQGTKFSAAAEDVTRENVPVQEMGSAQPYKVIDFNGGLHDLVVGEAEFGIVPAKDCYVVKTPQQLGNGEKLDANGLVYTGEDEKVSYYRARISNQPSAKYDDAKGTYLQMRERKTIAKVVKSKSAGTGNALETQELDKQIPYESADGQGVVVQEEYCANSEMYIANPFATKEGAKAIRSARGATMSYWMKLPQTEFGEWKPSSLLRLETFVEDEEGLRQRGELQIDTDTSIFWMPDETTEVSACALASRASRERLQEPLEEKCGDWHQVVISITADRIAIYIDGQETEASQRMQKDETWQQVLHGTDLIAWITQEDANLHFGGAGTFAPKAGCADGCEGYSMDDVKFYAGAWDEQQVQQAYTTERGFLQANHDVHAAAVNLVSHESISADVENPIQPRVEIIEGHRVYALQVASNEKKVKTAGAKIQNPFAGKDLEGATIGYWIKQADCERTSAITFMDEEKPIYHPKGNVLDARSVIYVENAGETMFVQGYSETSTANSVQNTYYTALHEDEKAAQLAKTSEWMYLTLTFSNGGIKYYVNGELMGEDVYYVPTSRFLDGYFQSEKDRQNEKLLYGTFGTTGNQGATTLMSFLTSEDTALYLGYYPAKGMIYNNVTPECLFAGIRTVDAALDDWEVKTFYEERFEGLVDAKDKITLEDAQMILKAALKIVPLDTTQELILDLNGDTNVNLTDAQLALKYALKIISGF